MNALLTQIEPYLWPVYGLIIFLGMLAVVFRALSITHDLSKTVLAQASRPLFVPPPPAPKTIAPTPVEVPAPAPRPPAPVPVPQTPAAPAPSGPFAGAPPWFQLALHEVGFHEVGNNQGIGKYIDMAHCGAEGDPWCAIFANAMLEGSGVRGTRSASSQSFRSSQDFVQLAGPALGAIAVFWRGSPSSGLGHVGFYRGEDASHVWTLGGNENDQVQIEPLPKASSSFGLIGYWWPRSAPMPTVGPVSVGAPVGPGTAPRANTSAAGGLQTNITATMFGGPRSAYGGPIDDNSPGVALPFHFPSPRPRVRVTGVRSGISVDCEIVDVGPWNIDDPYWTTGTRPEAESGVDLGQTGTRRKTNGAGIDLTLAAAKAVQIDGKGLVNWQFIDGPAKVT